MYLCCMENTIKRCTKCGENKSLDKFAFKNKAKNIFNGHCKECQNIMGREYYYKNLKKYYDKNKKRQLFISQYLKDIKNNSSCEKCGENHPACLDFHHINPKNKLYTISTMVTNSLNKVKEEIAKCIIICSNCHRKLHYNENLVRI